MANDMTPRRGYDFKSKASVDPVRLQSELDRIYAAFVAIRAFLDNSLDGDGSLKGSVVARRNLRSGIFSVVEAEILGRARLILGEHEQAQRTTQNFLTRALDAARSAEGFADQAGSVRSAVDDALQAIRLAQVDVVSGRSRSEGAMQLASVRASDAETAASSARISEDMAYRWAEKLDGPVFVPNGGNPQDDGFYSSKYWAIRTATSIENGSFYYLGARPSAPTTGNDGGPLQPGMWYYDTTTNITYIWNGTQWDAISGSGGVNSVFGRRGDVTAQATDYASFFYTKTEIDADQGVQDAAIIQNIQDIATNAQDITQNTQDITALEGRADDTDAEQGVQDAAIIANANAISTLNTDIPLTYMPFSGGQFTGNVSMATGAANQFEVRRDTASRIRWMSEDGITERHVAGVHTIPRLWPLPVLCCRWLDVLQHGHNRRR